MNNHTVKKNYTKLKWSDHLVKYFRISRSQKILFPFHEVAMSYDIGMYVYMNNLVLNNLLIE